ncbi:MAG: trigger factor [Polaribacter sp.]|jgi:trigger factor
MADVVRRDIDNLNTELTVVITVSDYEPKLKKALQTQSKRMQLKGFRKGKTPVSYVKKMYGQAILADEVNKLIEDTLNNHIKENKLRLLGHPIPSLDQEAYNFDLNALVDFSFKFDIGVAPEFELNSLDGSTFSVNGVEVPADMIDKDMEGLQKRHGERVNIEVDIQDNDIVEFEAIELKDGKARDSGWGADFSVLVKDSTDALKKTLLTKKKGDVININMYEVEKDKTKEHVIKYLYGASNEDDMTDVGADFEATIVEVSRIGMPEMDTAFFDKAFGQGVITSEEEARTKVSKDISSYYDKQADALLYRTFQDSLMENNEVALPDEFLKRWINSSGENKDRPDISDKEYEGFAKNLRWSLIQAKLVEHHGVEVSSEDVFEYIKDKIRGYFGGYGDELVILNTANRLMEDEKQVEQAYQELLADRMLGAMRAKVALTENKMSIADFDAIIQAEVTKQEAAKQALQPAVTENDGEEDVEEGIEEVTEDMD